MSVKLEIFFVDLIGYAFDGPNLWALMPKADRHLPMLVYFSAGNPAGDLALGTELQAVVPLDRTIMLDPPGGPGVVVAPADPVGEFPSAYDKSFRWVTKVDALVHPGLANCRLDPAVLGPNPTTISSRFLLDGGEIRSERFVVDKLGSVNMGAYRFRKGPPNLFRAMVNVTKLERILEGDSVTLRLTSWTGGNPSQIRLMPSQGTVSVVYMNLASEKAPPPASHFHLFAKLLKCTGQPPPDKEMMPTNVKHTSPTVNPAFTGIMDALKTALGDKAVLEALAHEFNLLSVFVNPETCPQGRYN